MRNEQQPIQHVEVKLHDGSPLAIEIHGNGPAVLLPTNPQPIEGTQAEALRKYGADPALGYKLIEGLRDAYRVIAFDYEGQVLRVPKPQTLTPENVAADLLAVADAAGVEQFAYYGYSWLAMAGLQLAIRTRRLSALVMGGYPPLDAPYTELLRVTKATYELAGVPAPAGDEWSADALSRDQTLQFFTLYQALQGFDDHAAQAQLTCPRLCFVGSADTIDYGENWGNVRVSLAEPVLRARAQLERLGWEVRILDGLDHMQAMQAAQVVPLLRAWFERVL